MRLPVALALRMHYTLQALKGDRHTGTTPVLQAPAVYISCTQQHTHDTICIRKALIQCG